MAVSIVHIHTFPVKVKELLELVVTNRKNVSKRGPVSERKARGSNLRKPLYFSEPNDGHKKAVRAGVSI